MAERVCGPCSRGQHAPCEGQNEFWGDCTCWCNVNDQGENPAYCESCEADRLWETEGIQPVWASPTHTCGRGRGVVGQEGESRVDLDV